MTSGTSVLIWKFASWALDIVERCRSCTGITLSSRDLRNIGPRLPHHFDYESDPRGLDQPDGLGFVRAADKAYTNALG